MKKAVNPWEFFILFASIAILFISFSVSLGFVLKYGGIDFTNRVNGSRVLMELKENPYTFKWSEQDSLRYLDPTDWQNPEVEVNRCTVTPFFLLIFYPIAKLNYFTARYLWFVLDWLFLLFSIVLLLGKKFKSMYIRFFVFLIISFSVRFFIHFERGEMYIFIVFLISLFIFFYRRKRYSLTGFFLALCFLVRPTTIIYLFPIMLFQFYNTKKILLPFLGFVIFLFSLSHIWGVSYLQWINYFQAMKQHDSLFFDFTRINGEVKELPFEAFTVENIWRIDSVIGTFDTSIKGLLFYGFHVKLYSMQLILLFFFLVIAPYTFIVHKNLKNYYFNRFIMVQASLLHYCLLFFIPASHHLYHEVFFIIPLLLVIREINLKIKIQDRKAFIKLFF